MHYSFAQLCLTYLIKISQWLCTLFVLLSRCRMSDVVFARTTIIMLHHAPHLSWSSRDFVKQVNVLPILSYSCFNLLYSIDFSIRTYCRGTSQQVLVLYVGTTFTLKEQEYIYYSLQQIMIQIQIYRYREVKHISILSNESIFII